MARIAPPRSIAWPAPSTHFAIAGVVTNLPFLSRLVADAEFRAGRVDTGLIDRNLDALLERGRVPDPVLALAAMHAAGALAEPVRRDARGDTASGDTPGPRRPAGGTPGPRRPAGGCGVRQSGPCTSESTATPSRRG